MIHFTKTTTAVLLAVLILPGLAFPEATLIERGKQLTEQVAKCQDCHTRRTPTGNLDKGAWLQGTPIDPAPAPSGKPTIRIPDITPEGTLWILWGERGMLNFLEKGTSPSGATPSTHMPAYKMRHDDAEAIVAYLKSLRRPSAPASSSRGSRR